MEEMKTEHAAALRKKETQVTCEAYQGAIGYVNPSYSTDYAA